MNLVDELFNYSEIMSKVQEEKLNIIAKLRKSFEKYNIDGYIIPSYDEFQNEYVPSHLRRLEYVTGFTGSNGVAVITGDGAFFYTDGRYTLQAQKELPEGFEIGDINNIVFGNGLTFGYDPFIHSGRNIDFYEKLAQKQGASLRGVENLVDRIWLDKPLASSMKAYNLGIAYTGKSADEKITEICAGMKAGHLLLCNPDSICWLLNIRAGDIEFTPFLLSYLILTKSGDYVLFADMEKVSGIGVKARPIEEVRDYFLGLDSVQMDPAKTPVWFTSHKNAIFVSDPCELGKAIKNPVEIKGIKECHVTDGIAVTKFIEWVRNNYKQGLDEIGAAEKLLEFRKGGKDFVCPSFETISAFGASGAVIHYKPTQATNRKIDGSSLYLIDSGGQYYSGTTDVTRTIALGMPTKEQTENYTLVLKGHIALATARFPYGTTGGQLDVLARQYLWGKGLDYAHGTGHGVGHFLSVHEGPQRIGKLGWGAALEEGMVVSNEPGYYKAGEYGIRLENLVLVKKSGYPGFLEFETLTLVPFDEALIDRGMLTEAEKIWLDGYHARVGEVIKLV